MNKIKQVTFSGIMGGDGECFYWRDISEADMKSVLGEKQYKTELKIESEIHKELYGKELTSFSVLYPDDVLQGCEHGKRYKFTVIVEEDNETT